MTQTSPHRWFGWVMSMVQTLLVVALCLVALVSFGTRIPWLAQHGLTLYAITSGSMEPMIPTGSLIYAQAYKPEDLKVGDVVTFQITGEGSNKPTVVTHRLAEVNKIEKTVKGQDNIEKKVVEYSFRTKGDANKQEDTQAISLGQILGKYAWHIPQIGKIALWAQTPIGFISTVVVPTIVLVAWEVASTVQEVKKSSHKKAEAEIDRLKAELAAAKMETKK